MTGLHNEVESPNIRAEVVRAARTTIPDLVQRIGSQVQDGVSMYSGPLMGRRRRLIDMAVTAAVSHYLDTIEKPSASGRSVDELFRRMGHGEASEGQGLAAMQSAFRIASHEAWEKIRSFATEHELSTETLGHLGDALFAYVEHLAQQAQLGFDGANRAFDQSPDMVLRRLIDAILDGASLAEIRTHASSATWAIPSMFVVVRVEPPTDQPVPLLPTLTARHLMRIEPTSAVIVTDAEALPSLLEELSAKAPGTRIATSWPILFDDAPDALRWTQRALDLVASGVIPATPIVDCGVHRTQLWLHAEPALRQRMCQDLLQPLLAETPNSREILSETLLAWLESRDSAPAIAAKLGVHPQTVRYRWKRINELFGDDLRDPEFVIQVTLLLKASVPLWKGGDQSDFERFRTKDVE